MGLREPQPGGALHPWLVTGLAWRGLQVHREPPEPPGALGLPWRWAKGRGSRSQQPLCPQACRGKEFDHGVVLECDSGEPEPEREADSFSVYLSMPPQTAVMFACSPGKGEPLPRQRQPKT